MYLKSCRLNWRFDDSKIKFDWRQDMWSLRNMILSCKLEKILLHVYSFAIKVQILIFKNRIGGVMVSVLALSAVDRGFEPWVGKTKDYKIGICCFSAKHAALRSMSKDWLARNQNNVSEWSDMSIRRLLFQHYKNPTQRVGLEQGVIRTRKSTSSSHLILTCSCHDIAENCWVGVKQQSLLHSL